MRLKETTRSAGKVPENLHAARKHCKMTLAEAGDQIGITKATLQRYESGAISNIPFENIEKLAGIYHTTPTQLMGWEADALFILADVFNLQLDKKDWNEHLRQRMIAYYNAMGSEIIESLLSKYSTLDERGRHTVNTVLEMEYERCRSCQNETSCESKQTSE